MDWNEGPADGAKLALHDWTFANLMKLAGFEALETHRIVILPKYVPLLSAFFNRFCARLPLFKRLCMTQVVVGRLLPPPVPKEELSVSVIVPCKNEKGNVEDAAQRIPQLGVRQKLFSVTISPPMEPLKKCCGCSRSIRTRIFVWNMDRAYASREMSGQVSMLPQAIS